MAAKRPNDSADSLSKRVYTSDYGRTITAEVGVDEVESQVHKDLICRASAIFEHACKSEWNKGQKQTIKLKTMATDDFQAYIEMLYAPTTDLLSLTTATRPSPMPIVDIENDAAVEISLCKRWVMGDLPPGQQVPELSYGCTYYAS
ncbi:hypothetical protein LTR62_002211 [Meristemomyces frigidus]|uniref:BTB domain-containing protein n=1 Tax=Meristemomyces frigidus TaxID=1508187 RepID=A0AAN7TG54_9PEZI|nr:hypothetical protein LTR62_002211 [Meristemomyces frigidus]